MIIRRRRLLDMLIFGLAIAMTVNFVAYRFERFREDFFFFCVLAAVLRLIFPMVKGRKIVVGVFIVILMLPFLARGVSYLSKHGNADAKFDDRVATLLADNLRLYRSRWLPEDRYGLLKSVAKRVFAPELRDSEHRYQSIDIECTHIDSGAVIAYKYVGDTYGKTPVPLTFSCFGESDSVPKAVEVLAQSLTDMTPIEVKNERIEDRGSRFLYVGEIPLDSLRFEVMRVARMRGTMKEQREGFLLDLRNIVHPPTHVSVKLLRNVRLENIMAWRVTQKKLSPENRFLNWMFLKPSYEKEILLGQSRPLEFSRAEFDSGAENMKRHLGDENAIVEAGRWEIPMSGDSELNVYLISYHVDKSQP